ncbi:MAG: hypothetical protein LBP63_11190 [Prevotellaceae bacterium]|jgi:uncharacterized protein|nr:hypothetical protein [Prevotellaceae bacterium]
MTKYLTADNITFAMANLNQLVFEVTDVCNLQCKYCGYGELYDDHDKREDKMLPTKKAIRLIDYLAEFWKSKINTSAQSVIYISFYGGEPLLNMPFMENKPICHGYMNEHDFQNYVNTQMDFLRKHPEAYQKIMEEVIIV